MTTKKHKLDDVELVPKATTNLRYTFRANEGKYVLQQLFAEPVSGNSEWRDIEMFKGE